MENFEHFITTLKNYELLTLLSFRKEEMTPIQIKVIVSEINYRVLDEKDYELIKEDYKNKNESTIKCPRCSCSKTESNNQEQIVSFREFWINYLFTPWNLKKRYHCLICNLNFKKWITLSEVITLLRNE